MWSGIAITFVLIVGAFLLGIYLIFKKLSNKVGDVPKQIVDKSFHLINEQLTIKQRSKEKSKARRFVHDDEDEIPE